MIIENPSEIKKENLRIFIKGYDCINRKSVNYHLNPKDVDELILTKPTSVSTEIFQLKPDLNILFFSKGNLIASINPIDDIPEIFKNEKLFYNLSKYKKRKLMWVFCKAVCSNRIRILFDLNRIRNSRIIKEVLIKMRELDKKLIKVKTREELMGIEGNVTKQFYSGLSELSDIWYRNFKRRDRNSSDIVNCLMNFGHTILRSKIKYRLYLNGLNPYHSFLHDSDRNQEYLTFDFAEFWIAYIDKLIFYSLEKGIIKESDLNNNGLLNENSKIKLIKLIDKRILNEEIDKKIKEFMGYLKGENRFGWKISFKHKDI